MKKIALLAVILVQGCSGAPDSDPAQTSNLTSEIGNASNTADNASASANPKQLEVTPPLEQVSRDILRKQLFDSESARFSDLREAGTNYVCGLVNAKNRMGAYTGFKPFIIQRNPDGNYPAVMISEDNNPPSLQAYNYRVTNDQGIFETAFFLRCSTPSVLAAYKKGKGEFEVWDKQARREMDDAFEGYKAASDQWNRDMDAARSGANPQPLETPILNDAQTE